MKTDYSNMTLSELASEIRKDWSKQGKGVHPYCKEWLYALSSISTIHDHYGAESGLSVVCYFLSNSASWKGEVAREIKKELNNRIKN